MEKPSHPTIKKASYIKGKTLTFRNAVIGDAQFILSLRVDPQKSRYLSPVSDDLELQQEWLKKYSLDEGQAYFVIEFNRQPIGTIRIYDAVANSFCWGSWILKEGSPQHAAIESTLMIYLYGIAHLGFESSHFDVRKNNRRVIAFHERLGATRISETVDDYIFKISNSSILAIQSRYAKYLPNGIFIEDN